MPNSEEDSPRVLIIGAGMSGLCMAIRLKQAGFNNVVVLESSCDVGGTWFKNTYPNAGCDVPSFLYSFSFAPNHGWTTKYARQPEILAYFRNCVDRFSLRSNIRFNTFVESAVFNEDKASWTVTSTKGERFTADFVISAVGQLNRPHVPDFPGLESFEGEHWHSARWNHDFDFSDKTVAVIGNGASAIQFLPEIAEQSKKIILVARTPCWIHPLNNYRYPKWARWAFAFVPLCEKLHRWWIYWMCEWRIFAFRDGSKLNREYARWLRRKMRRLIPEQDWPKVIPEYAPGCKRILLSSDYLQTLGRDDVQLITGGVVRFEPDGIVTPQGSHAVDAVIFATGFKANEFLQPLKIEGRNGQDLQNFWGERPRAFHGMATTGFPNLFMLYGPNTNLGHNSIIFMVERQVNYIIRCLRRMTRTRSKLIEVKQRAMDGDVRDVQERLQASVWAGDCTNWYKSADGTIPNNWWGSATSYWLRLRRPKYSDFEFSDE